MQENFILATTSGAVAENETGRLQALTVKKYCSISSSLSAISESKLVTSLDIENPGEDQPGMAEAT